MFCPWFGASAYIEFFSLWLLIILLYPSRYLNEKCICISTPKEMTWTHIEHDLLTKANRIPVFDTAKHEQTWAFIGWAVPLPNTPTVFNRKYWFHGSSEKRLARTLLYLEGCWHVAPYVYIYTNPVGHFSNVWWPRISRCLMVQRIRSTRQRSIQQVTTYWVQWVFPSV